MELRFDVAASREINEAYSCTKPNNPAWVPVMFAKSSMRLG